MEANHYERPPLAVHYQTLDDQRVVAEAAESVVVLNGVRVYAEGCVLDYTAATRLRPRREAFTRADLRSLVDEQAEGAAPSFAVTAAGTSLTPLTGGQAATDGDVATVQRVLWLYPLPPDHTFTVTVSWRAYGIEGVDHEIDGARIRDAAGRVRPYWPDRDPGGGPGLR